MNFFTSLWRKMFPVVLHGTAYPWLAYVDGDDIVVKSQGATWFGGNDDPLDNGETASGVSTRDNPQYLGCALPLNYGPCKGSPIPVIPWHTMVVVTNRANLQTITLPVIDEGPAPPPYANAAIDLTQQAFKDLGGDLENGRMLVDYRVLGGAKYLHLS